MRTNVPLLFFYLLVSDKNKIWPY